MRRVQSAAPNLDFTMEDMFKIATKQTSAFGIEGYEVTKKYADPLKQMEDRKFATQKKGQKNLGYVTRRGHYLEDQKRIYEKLPAPNKYDIVKPWVIPLQIARSKSAPPKRSTFIDQIFKEAKLRAVPGSGKYNIVPPLEEVLKQVEEQKKKKIEAVERPTYLNEIQHLAVINPGPGNYNPRPISKKLKINQTKPADFIAKDKELAKKRGKSALPDIGTYHPEPVQFTTFNKLLDLTKRKDKLDRNTFGKDVRFKDPKKSKSKQILLPGPGQYPMVVQWAGKEQDKNKTKQKTYLQAISKGCERSIYY
ncbi:unnamed protein product (macronuclear) [Paramecium tetraurelia]|uniref:Uncharacterized protein n=1 Tax=Paramecium tetraurelia TaxID=5888 RepID=A0CQF4_PARTE|nr:uncharacterized protein GSPATT00009369001 [Paramecium tetraurelia]CAK73021.1 unnamed protein product [Paramecium tetraurelia]|eukprot:XP_001440418.1 hypothetical protein (macronuclear) [Paramecium tetraurelia strain d4-2]